MIVCSQKEKYILGKNIGLITPKSIGIEIEKIFEPSDTFLIENIKKKFNEDISDESIKNNLSNVKILTLQITQNCNLRCSYCAFSGIYNSRRVHQPKRMSIITAKKAIDFFFKTINLKSRTGNSEKIIIGFYGGEGLLEYETIIQAIEYAKNTNTKNNFEIEFTLTTNGVLLTPERIKKFVEEDISLDISLDGPKEEHDRFRVNAVGEGSFDKIIQNVEFIYNIFPEYFKKKIRFYVTIHPFHDLTKIESFFLSRPEIFNEDVIRINNVNLSSLDNDLKKKWMEGKNIQSEQKKSQLQQCNWFYKKIVSYPIEKYFRGSGTFIRSFSNSFSAACFPGGLRLFIDVDGKFHICEKMDESFSIGNCDCGYDINRIKIILNTWKKEIEKRKCWECDCVSECSFCYASQGRNGRLFIKKTDCLTFRANLKKLMLDYLSLREVEDEKSSAETCDTIATFLESL